MYPIRLRKPSVVIEQYHDLPKTSEVQWIARAFLRIRCNFQYEKLLIKRYSPYNR